jgi:uncharacterized RDD family membrane protein YckC
LTLQNLNHSVAAVCKPKHFAKEPLMVDANATSSAVHYGGFWRRVVALIIDYLLVSFVLFALFAVAALVAPSAADLVDLSEFGWLNVERTLETKPPTTTVTDKGTETATEKIVESTVAGRWVYVHRVIETETVKKSDNDSSSKPFSSTREERTRLDPATRGEMSGVSPLYYFWLPWLVYAVLMEGGTHQATFGKMAIGIKVTTDGGTPNTYPRALVRNLLKVLSALTLFVGFAMAGWTQRKQALHDKIAECLVIVGKS